MEYYGTPTQIRKMKAGEAALKFYKEHKQRINERSAKRYAVRTNKKLTQEQKDIKLEKINKAYSIANWKKLC
jgi:hypothetical protein